MNRRILKAEFETREYGRVVYSSMLDMEVEKLTTGMEVPTVSKNDNVDIQEDLKADSKVKTLKDALITIVPFKALRTDSQGEAYKPLLENDFAEYNGLLSRWVKPFKKQETKT